MLGSSRGKREKSDNTLERHKTGGRGRTMIAGKDGEQIDFGSY